MDEADLSTAGHDFQPVYLGFFKSVHIYALYAYDYEKEQILSLCNKIQYIENYTPFNAVRTLEIIDTRGLQNKVRLEYRTLNEKEDTNTLPHFLRTEKLMLPHIGVLVEATGKNEQDFPAYAFFYTTLEILVKILKDQSIKSVNLPGYGCVVKAYGTEQMSIEARLKLCITYLISNQSIKLFLKDKIS